MTTSNNRTPNNARDNMSKRPKPKQPTGIATWILLIISFMALAFAIYTINDRTVEEPIETITREGVVTQIQQLNRLQTVAFSVDTVITSERQGSWMKLWQDEQKGLFIARGRVDAGINLSALTPEMVQVVQAEQSDTDVDEAKANDANTSVLMMPQINITLPPSEIFSVYLDDLEIYDWQTGAFGLMQVDPKILEQAQIMAKKEVLERACRGDVMNMALQNAKTQLQQLFAMTGAVVTVTTQGAGACQMPAVTSN
ncbi:MULTISPECIES: DUF4230 domain-containing protein [unclassified Psychrobacter]|uniref:DUF4230 domain-containing protein n=1 Tax=unclassified Psychrobacter TaxID=196806 RepID=UPI00071E809E|nr:MULTISPECIES: DUF4230 domain-containing protein [unclassified Psychrobacter]OLF35928.1 hypothetical protein BTV98_12270 [Psychrobacter sp. Cmf 22.2]